LDFTTEQVKLIHEEIIRDQQLSALKKQIIHEGILQSRYQLSQRQEQMYQLIRGELMQSRLFSVDVMNRELTRLRADFDGYMLGLGIRI
jgi:hypothetical protein